MVLNMSQISFVAVVGDVNDYRLPAGLSTHFGYSMRDARAHI
jgi:hypothetical protein